MNTLNNESEHCCIEIPKEDWLVRVDDTLVCMNYLKHEDSIMLKGKMLEHGHVCRGQLVSSASHASERSVYDFIEEDPVESYHYIEKESLNTPDLLPRLALYLSAKTIEKICDIIFTKKAIDEKFVPLFYKYFFHFYFRREYSWSSLHLLIKASKSYPVHFKTTIHTMLMDSEIPNKILLDYVENLCEKDCTNLLKDVCGLQLRLDQFIRNLSVIYLMYKKSRKNDYSFQYILSALEWSNRYCASNKNYGKLLLCVIQNLSRGDERTLSLIETMTENHFSVYKSACQTALMKFVSSILDLQEYVDETPRIVIPREVDHIQCV